MAVQSTPWYANGVTQRFGTNGEQGIDIAEPFHTSITALYGGVVTAATYTRYGSDLQIQIPNSPYMEEYLHQDLLLVKAGDVVAPGQVIGLSGGETPQQALSLPGAMHPAYVGSTGPHVEFDIAQNGTYLDPAGIISAATGGKLATASPLGGTGTATTDQSGWSFLQWLQWLYGQSVGQPGSPVNPTGNLSGQTPSNTPQVPALPDPSSFGAAIGSGISSGILTSLGINDNLNAWAQNVSLHIMLVLIGLFLIIGVILWLVLSAISSPKGQGAVRAGTTVAKMAAK